MKARREWGTGRGVGLREHLVQVEVGWRVILKIPEQVMRWDGLGRELYGLRTPRLGHEKGGRRCLPAGAYHGLGLSTRPDLTV